eukprot:767880-Hanusia_phi.AAC.9
MSISGSLIEDAAVMDVHVSAIMLRGRNQRGSGLGRRERRRREGRSSSGWRPLILGRLQEGKIFAGEAQGRRYLEGRDDPCRIRLHGAVRLKQRREAGSRICICSQGSFSPPLSPSSTQAVRRGGNVQDSTMELSCISLCSISSGESWTGTRGIFLKRTSEQQHEQEEQQEEQQQQQQQQQQEGEQGAGSREQE